MIHIKPKVLILTVVSCRSLANPNWLFIFSVWPYNPLYDGNKKNSSLVDKKKNYCWFVKDFPKIYAFV